MSGTTHDADEGARRRAADDRFAATRQYDIDTLAALVSLANAATAACRWSGGKRTHMRLYKRVVLAGSTVVHGREK